MNSLQTARMEKELDITGTYYFRMVPGSYDEEVIKQIAGLGHEIGYHYEDISRCAASGMRPSEIAQVPRTDIISPGRHAAENKDPLLGGGRALKNPVVRDFSEGARLQGRACGGARGGLKGPQDLPDASVGIVVSSDRTARFARRNIVKAGPHDKVLPDEELTDIAITSFRENLAKLRRVVPIETICMHGSPLSKYDNRILWEYYNYRDYGIIGEPYFDINFEEVLYLTDTGRRWDGEAFSVRDRAISSKKTKSEEHCKPQAAPRKPVLRFHSTFDIITAAKTGTFPDKIMLTVHPQRWTNKSLPWIKELIWQNVKNAAKRFINNSLRKSARNGF